MTRTRLSIVAAALAATTTASIAAPAVADEIAPNDFRISDMGPNGNTSYGALDPAVAYNSVDDRFLVVWVGDDLVDGEREIHGQLIDSDGSEIGQDFRISDMGPEGNITYTVSRPAVAYDPDANQFLVVWSGDDNTIPLVDNEMEIFGQLLDGATGATEGSNDFRISDMGPDGNPSYQAYFPRVAYNATEGEYLVVWNGDDDTGGLVDAEVEIFGQRIEGATGNEVGGDFRISDMGPDGNSAFNAYVAAVAYNAIDNEYLVVWQGDDNTLGHVDQEFEIFGQRLSALGAEIGSNDFYVSDMGPIGSNVYEAYEPAVVHNPDVGEYLVTWSATDDTAPLVAGEFEIFGQRLSSSGAAVGADDFRISDMGPDGNTSYAGYSPSLAYDRVHKEYLVVWWGSDNTPPLVAGEYEVFGQRLRGNTASEIGDNDFRLSDMGPDGNTSYFAFGTVVAYGDPYLVVWWGDDNTAPLVDNEDEIFGQLWQTPFVGETVGLVDPAAGLWRLRNQAGVVTSFYFGNPGDYPIMGDWDCDGVDTPGMYRQADGYVYLRNSNTQGPGDIRFFFGNPGDLPIVGDFDADGCDTVGIYRPTEGRFYIINELGANDGGLGAADFSYLFGNPGDKPFIGDFDGDGTDTVGLHRESTGFVYFRNSHTQGIADNQFFFGDPADRLVAGDWGIVDGVDTPAVYRPATTTFYFRHSNTQGNADATLVFGQPTWLPVAGTFGLD